MDDVKLADQKITAKSKLMVKIEASAAQVAQTQQVVEDTKAKAAMVETVRRVVADVMKNDVSRSEYYFEGMCMTYVSGIVDHCLKSRCFARCSGRPSRQPGGSRQGYTRRHHVRHVLASEGYRGHITLQHSAGCRARALTDPYALQRSDS